jgi:Holliday junction resolvase
LNSNQKGKRGEREAAAFLTDEGFPARRGQQFAGGTDSPDVVCESLSGLHFEVKRT